jgi:hypothetical protein
MSFWRRSASWTSSYSSSCFLLVLVSVLVFSPFFPQTTTSCVHAAHSHTERQGIIESESELSELSESTLRTKSSQQQQTADSLHKRTDLNDAAALRELKQNRHEELNLIKQHLSKRDFELYEQLSQNFSMLETYEQMGECPPLQAELCFPCYKFTMPGHPLCAKTIRECYASICRPLCLRMTWEVDFVVSCNGHPKCPKLAAELAQPHFKRAVGAQLIAHGCERMLQCCPGDPELVDVKHWAEDWNYGGYFPEPGVMTPACHHTPEFAKESADLCAMCQSAVKVVLKTTNDCEFLPVQKKPVSSWAFDNSNVVMPIQLPRHKPFQERCVKTRALVASKFGEMTAEFQSKICECLGCCAQQGQETCYYPVNFDE